MLAASRIDVGPGDAVAAGRGQPQALVTTTPRRVAVLKRILAEATTVQTTDTTYANQAHLPRAFLSQIVGMYENTQAGAAGDPRRVPGDDGGRVVRQLRPGPACLGSRPSTIPGTRFAARSTRGRRGTRRRCFSRFARV